MKAKIATWLKIVFFGLLVPGAVFISLSEEYSRLPLMLLGVTTTTGVNLSTTQAKKALKSSRKRDGNQNRGNQKQDHILTLQREQK